LVAPHENAGRGLKLAKIELDAQALEPGWSSMKGRVLRRRFMNALLNILRNPSFHRHIPTHPKIAVDTKLLTKVNCRLSYKDRFFCPAVFFPPIP
jgi:hypothetical protein